MILLTTVIVFTVVFSVFVWIDMEKQLKKVVDKLDM